MVSVPQTINVEVRLSDALDQVSIDEAIAFYGQEDILNEIGVEEVKRYFDLTEAE